MKDHVWRLLLQFVKDWMEDGVRRLSSGEELLPAVMYFSYCNRCDHLVKAMSLIAVDIETMRRKFPQIVLRAFEATGKCDKCSGDTWPVGYAFRDTVSILNVEGRSSDEVEAYWRAFQTVEHHPESRNAFMVAVVTHMDRRKAFFWDIVQTKRGVKLVRNRRWEKCDVGGRFILPLPRLTWFEDAEGQGHAAGNV